MKCIVKATRIGTIKDLDKRKDLQLADLSQDVKEIKSYFGNRPAVKDFDGFFVKVEDGDFQEVYGYEGSIPRLNKDVYKITRTCK